MIRAEPSLHARTAIYGAIAAERFAWYTFLASFVLSLVQAGTPKAQASHQYGLLLASAYLAPLFGGFFGGRTSLRLSVLLGLGFLCIAYTLGALHSPSMMIYAAIGCGLFKPCLATLLTSLYPANDPRKIKSMSVYYLWIQLGSIPSALVAAALHVWLGWSAVYLACAAVVVLAAVFILSSWHELVPFRSDLETFIGTSIATVKQDEPWKLGALLTLLVGGVIFFVANQQQGSTLTFWAEYRVDRHTIWGDIPAESFGTLNPVFCALLTPLIVRWTASARIRLIAAMGVLGMSFGVLLLPVGTTVTGLCLAYLLGATCELLISPGGMAAVTDLVPRKYAALGMALWLGTTALGGYLAGVFGGWRMETAAVVTVLLTGLGACWYAWRWPVEKVADKAEPAKLQIVEVGA